MAYCPGHFIHLFHLAQAAALLILPYLVSSNICEVNLYLASRSYLTNKGTVCSNLAIKYQQKNPRYPPFSLHLFVGLNWPQQTAIKYC